MKENSFTPTALTTISRHTERGVYDKNLIYPIMDEVMDITISYIENGIPRAIPTGFVRIHDVIYIHGSVKSHFIMQVANCDKVCMTISILDGLVLANTAFHHSFNYRGVIAYGQPVTIEDEELKMEVFRAFTEKILPGRWNDDIKKPSLEELKATAVIGLKITEASAKIREGQAKNSSTDADKGYQAWTGIIPIKRVYQQPEVHPDCKEYNDLPEYFNYLKI
jgi:uncharacterized protein